jgi:RES domain-containing protein
MALDAMTAIIECTQGLGQRLKPLTLCEYDIDCEDIADLGDPPARARHGVDLGDLACSWLAFQRAGKEAPSWLAVDRLRAAGHHGLLVQSFAPGATEANRNLVLWRWGSDLPRRVQVYDPTRRLPESQQSWPNMMRGA